MRRLLDAEGNALTEYYHDESTDIGYIRKVERFGPRVELNKRLQKEKVYADKKRPMARVASIPPIIAHQWMIDDGVIWFQLRGDDLEKYLNRKLNDPDWKWLRTSEGRI